MDPVSPPPRTGINQQLCATKKKTFKVQRRVLRVDEKQEWIFGGDVGMVGVILFVMVRIKCLVRIEPWGFTNCRAGPGAYSDRGCLLFQVSLATGSLPGQTCLGNVK